MIKICEETKTKFQRMINSTEGHLPRGRGMYEKLSSSMIQAPIFKALTYIFWLFDSGFYYVTFCFQIHT